MITDRSAQKQGREHRSTDNIQNSEDKTEIHNMKSNNYFFTFL